MDTKPKALKLSVNKGGYSETGQITRDTLYLDLAPVIIHDGEKVKYEPECIEMVFVGQRALKDTGTSTVHLGKDYEDGNLNNNENIDSSREKSTFVFKTCRDGYLSFNLKGEIQVESVAIGPTEMWEPILRIDEEGPGSVALMAKTDLVQNSVKGLGKAIENKKESVITNDFSFTTSSRFLSTNPKSAGLGRTTSNGNSEKRVIHSYANTIGFGEIFKVYCQAKVRFNRILSTVKKIESKKTQDLQNEEIEIMKKYQSWKNLEPKASNESKKDLKKAKEEGGYYGKLLERREKLKSDKFCK
ncbi:hypothetical protein BB559_005924 [Furculomyces boomerangus]|uniref:Uncharacterized protein n=1 Tax=Furculomyces boomerangus TaxID=61424 RepID=A0A2T9Y5X4_9FUNG|nr:hypothetical protein BB559_005924 [Furculomyces boomerangus]